MRLSQEGVGVMVVQRGGDDSVSDAWFGVICLVQRDYGNVAPSQVAGVDARWRWFTFFLSSDFTDTGNDNDKTTTPTDTTTTT